MSSYNKFLAFEQATKERLGDDILRMVHKAMNFTRQELREEGDRLKIKLADTRMDYSDHSDYLQGKINDASREFHLLVSLMKLDPSSEIYARFQQKVEDAKKEYRDAHAQYRADVEEIKRSFRRVAKEHNELVQ